MVSMEEGGFDVPKRDLQRSRECISKITSLKPISHAKIVAASMVFASDEDKISEGQGWRDTFCRQHI